ncbi:MAG TPA: GntR family transcriptional regulator, partial [Trebonia sp.]|nr:GntR family transcriptional regulator [Trebonia sp.]
MQPVARYEQIARDLRQRILDGDWAPGVTMPGAPTLAAEYGVTQSVAQKALEVVVSWRLARTGA